MRNVKTQHESGGLPTKRFPLPCLKCERGATVDDLALYAHIRGCECKVFSCRTPRSVSATDAI